MNVALYFNQLEDLIRREQYTENAYNKYFDNHTSVAYRNENTGSQDIYGFDLFFSLKYSTNVSANLSYSYTKSRNIDGDDTNPIARLSPHKMLVSAVFSNILGVVSISPQIRIAGPMYNYNTIYFPDGKQKGYKYNGFQSRTLLNKKNTCFIYKTGVFFFKKRNRI